MDTTLKTPFQDQTIRMGLIILALSFITFAFTIDIFSIDFDIFSSIFFFNYGVTFFYFIVVLKANKKETDRYFRFPSFARNVILLQLFNISAYSLNRTIPVFSISTNWLIWFLLISNISLLFYALRQDHRLKWFNHIIVVLANLGFLFHAYESIYVGQGYPFALIGFWFFGIPLHIFVPLLFVWAYGKLINTFLKANPTFWTTTLLTWFIAIGSIAFFSVRFYQVNKVVDENFHLTQQPYQDKLLPKWVSVSQQLKKSWITERALKCGLVYTSSDDAFSGFMEGPSINERVKHDPLVVIASLFAGEIDMNFDDRIKMLNFMFDTRHQTERKLWSGENLSTTDIVTNVQLFPQYRLAYTEKTFKIKNTQVGRWGRQQEALYTFYLPEGSVVTSAALWVNGKEEPAYLTTKGKANNAYTQIVGRERRDPLLLHWQEGNTVTVRVFPCTPDEDRQFKIGVTTPLEKKAGQLVYENIDFKGPYWKGAKESINIVSEGELANLSTPYSFSQKGNNYSYLGNYKSDWTLTFDALALSEKPFSFSGKSYQLESLQSQPMDFKAKTVYLDINAAWSNKELNTIWDLIKDKQVFVYANNRMEPLNTSNKDGLFDFLQSQNFSLFPFYQITKPEEALVISKFNQTTPTLSDLKGTAFLEETSTFFNQNKSALKLFNIGEEVSPYLKTLRELRTVQLEKGTLDELLSLLKQNQFYKNQEDEQTIVNQYANFKIKAGLESSAITNAPDHLMRLFSYNNILRKVGKNYFAKEFLENEFVEEAKSAYVVTPVSSLIVLETQADYDRFDIKKSKNSLDNASIGNSGAVPEPHEWLLIIMVLMMTLYFYFRK